MNAIEPYNWEFSRFSGAPIRCRATEMTFQRNGVGGNGFFVVRFQCSEAPERPLLGIVFDEPHSCAVIDPNDLASHWRGDAFESGLRECIAARQEQMWAVA